MNSSSEPLTTSALTVSPGAAVGGFTSTCRPASAGWEVVSSESSPPHAASAMLTVARRRPAVSCRVRRRIAAHYPAPGAAIRVPIMMLAMRVTRISLVPLVAVLLAVLALAAPRARTRTRRTSRPSATSRSRR